ncbi:MAG: hypothetical protein ABI301_02015 [Jatrophihabitantaceae bacterium]
MVVYADSGWPLWARALIDLGAAALVAAMVWRYYVHYWRRK